MLTTPAQARADRLRHLSARLYRLSERIAVPARSHGEVERIIDEGEGIASAIRREFR